MPDYEKAARKAAKKYGVDPDIYVAQLRQESGLKMGLRSPAGAQDIAQFMPGTAKSYGVTLGDGRAADDLDGGARYMRDNLKQFGGDYSKALAAYNAGAGAVQKYGGVPPYKETQNYVSTILANAGKGSAPKLKKTAAPKAPAAAPTQATAATPGVDNSGLRRELVGQFLQQGGVANPNAVLTLAGSYGQAADVPATTAPAAASYAQPQPQSQTSAKTPKLKMPTGVADFEGSEVAAWIAPALKYARKHGWKGHVNSGFRSLEDQTRIYNSGVRPAAKPGTSNHEGADYPRGAVDVSDAETLSRIIAASPYAKKLQWAGAKDPVHFSHPHNGSY